MNGPEYDGPPFPADDAQESQTTNAPDAPFPLYLRWPGIGTTWIRTPDDRWVIVDDRTIRAETENMWPMVPLFRKNAKGNVVPTTPAHLQEERGRRVDSVIYDLTTDRHVYVPNASDLGGELILSCAKLDPAATPRRDIECEAWLDRLGGEARGRLLDWLATVTDLTMPTAALYLRGEASAGKGLLAGAVARLWGRAVTDYAKVCTRFNSSMRDCPIVLLDEGARMDPNGSASFRSLVGQRSRAIEDKGRPVATLLGCVRLIIAANNPDALRIREDLNADDEDAIGKRILMIEIPPGARDLLSSMAHSEWVDRKDGTPGRLVRHLAWLIATREVRRGPRFLVEGDSGAWVRGAARRGGLQQEALNAIARFAVGAASDLGPLDVPVWIGEGAAYVSVDRLHRVWARIMPGARVPSLNALARAIAVVAPTMEQQTRDYARVRVRVVPAAAVLDAAAEAAIGVDEDLRAMFGVE